MVKIYNKMLIFLLLSAVSNSLLASDDLFGSLTKQEAKDFLVGLGIGATHGVVNQSIGAVGEVNGYEMPIIALLATYIATNKFEGNCNGGKPNSAMLWGRGIGQILTESIQFILNEQQKRTLKFKLILNLSIFKALCS